MRPQIFKTYPDKKLRDRAIQRRRKYGIEPHQVARLLAEQNGHCGLCRQTDPGHYDWAVDHCHKTGLIRGLLCHPCNRFLGRVEKDLAWPARALAYLQTGGANLQPGPKRVQKPLQFARCHPDRQLIDRLTGECRPCYVQRWWHTNKTRYRKQKSA